MSGLLGGVDRGVEMLKLRGEAHAYFERVCHGCQGSNGHWKEYRLHEFKVFIEKGLNLGRGAQMLIAEAAQCMDNS